MSQQTQDSILHALRVLLEQSKVLFEYRGDNSEPVKQISLAIRAIDNFQAKHSVTEGEDR